MCNFKTLTVIVTDKPSDIRNGDIADWKYSGLGHWVIIVPRLPKEVYTQALLRHELTEMDWCARNGVSVERVDKWDAEFALTHTGSSEAGLDPNCPYHEGHMIALKHEREYMLDNHESWGEYDAALDEWLERNRPHDDAPGTEAIISGNLAPLTPAV